VSVCFEAPYRKSVVSAHDVNLHQYADDCQLYLSVPVDDAPSAVTRLSQCIADVAELLSASRLRLNPDNTVIIIIINVKINVALSENASRIRYTIKIKLKLKK